MSIIKVDYGEVGGGTGLKMFLNMLYDGSYKFMSFDAEETPPVQTATHSVSSSATFECPIGTFTRYASAYHRYDVVLNVDVDLYGQTGTITSSRVPPTGATVVDGTHWHFPAGSYRIENFYDMVDGSRNLFFIPS